MTQDEESDLILRDNINNGEWDFNALQVDDLFADVDFNFIGLDIPNLDKSDAKSSKRQTDEIEEPDEEEQEKEAFYRSMFKDVLYESDNEFEIPNLLLEMQAGKVELPLSPWGANGRLRKDVATYHFYVDDYRFEAFSKTR